MGCCVLRGWGLQSPTLSLLSPGSSEPSVGEGAHQGYEPGKTQVVRKQVMCRKGPLLWAKMLVVGG